jgi:hypothetical protein
MLNASLPAACGAVLLAITASAMGQAAPGRPAASQPTARTDEKAVIGMLDRIPGDAAGFVLIPCPKGVCQRADTFIRDIVPRQFASEFDAHKLFLDERELGEGLDDAAPLAIVLLDPSQHAPKAQKSAGTGEEVQESRTMPVLFLLSCKDPSKMFPGREVKKDGDLLELSRGGEVA